MGKSGIIPSCPTGPFQVSCVQRRRRYGRAKALFFEDVDSRRGLYQHRHPGSAGSPPQSPLPPVPKPPSKIQLKANQKEIKKDVDQLFSLAQDLKEEAGKTDTVVVLSVAFVQKTEEIEKLAKKIRDLARD